MKTRFLAIAAVAALFAASCTEAELQTPVAAGEEVTVSFVAQAPEAISTKAFSDGQTAKNLYYAVYATGEQAVLTQGEATFENLKASVTITLVTGKTYDLIFWAQAEGAPYNFDMAAQTVTVDYAEGTVEANDELRDAFYKSLTYKVEGSATNDVVLTRPFAQINVGTNDITVAEGVGYNVSGTTMKATVPTKINLMTNRVGEETAEVTFAATGRPESQIFPVADYEYLAMNYILASADKKTTTIDFTINGINDIPFNFTNVPVQRNYRTNIYGALITDPTTWNVEINPAYQEPDHNHDLAVVTTAAELIDALANGESVTLADDIAVEQQVVVTKSATLDLNGYTLSNTADIWNQAEDVKAWSVISVQGGTLTLKNGKIDAKENDCYAIDVRNGAKVIVENGTYTGNVSVVYVLKGEAEINGGEFSLKQLNDGKCKDYALFLNCKDDNYKDGVAKITVTGGTFTGFNPADNAAEGEGTNFVAKGCISLQDGNDYIVVEGVPEETVVAGTNEAVSEALGNAAPVVVLREGTYTIPKAAIGKEVSFIGSGKPEDTVIDCGKGSQTLSSSNVVFENVTIKTANGNYQGFQHTETAVYKNCIIDSQYTLYGPSEFIGCTFVVTENQYNIWTYGADATFTDCVFNCGGKAVLVYNEDQYTDDTVIFNNCTFNDNGELDVTKAAVEAAANHATVKHTIKINSCTVNGFAVTGQETTTHGGTELGTNVWGNKNLMTAENLEVVVDGVVAY